MHDLRVLNGLIVSDGETRLADVAIDAGRITDVADPDRLVHGALDRPGHATGGLVEVARAVVSLGGARCQAPP
ncbi:MAG: hypothetical protein ABIR11_06675, partial [Candidatus Limnocylindrales bacterium]